MIKLFCEKCRKSRCLYEYNVLDYFKHVYSLSFGCRGLRKIGNKSYSEFEYYTKKKRTIYYCSFDCINKHNAIFHPLR